MASIDESTVDHLAKLAHLKLTPEEETRFARHLAQILTYAESLQTLPVDAVAPMSHAASAEIFRPDTPREELRRETVLAAAPDGESGLFRVPKVIGG